MNQAKNPECQAGRVDIAVEQCVLVASKIRKAKSRVTVLLQYYCNATGISIGTMVCTGVIAVISTLKI